MMVDKLLGKGGQTFGKSIFKKHRKASYIHDGGQTFIILKYIKVYIHHENMMVDKVDKLLGVKKFEKSLPHQ